MNNNDTNDSTFLRHEPCEQCGSSDARAVYDDGHSYCYSCEEYRKGEEGDTEYNEQRHSKVSAESKTKGFLYGATKELRNRNIKEETTRKWGYMVGQYKNQTCHIANFYDETGQVVAQKVRLPQKNFLALGDFSKAGLYGSHLWASGKKLVITEGEIDAGAGTGPSEGGYGTSDTSVISMSVSATFMDGQGVTTGIPGAYDGPAASMTEGTAMAVGLGEGGAGAGVAGGDGDGDAA